MERIAFLFTGQGAQYVGMAQSLYDEYIIAKQTFEEANDVLGFNLAKLCFEGTLGKLSKTENTQPALLTASIAAYRVYMQEIGIAPLFCAGHSLGEYSALVSAGAVKFSDALRIVRQRGLFTKEIADAKTGGMTLIDGIDRTGIEEICRRLSNSDKILMINCYNSPEQYAIAGHQELVDQAGKEIMGMNAQITPLFGSAPFHTPLMRPAADKLKPELEKCTYYPFKWPVITNVTGKPYKEPEKIADTLIQQFISPVQWQSTMQYLKNKGITVAIEMGPKNILTNLVKENTPEIKTFCFGSKEDKRQLFELLSEDTKSRKDISNVITKSMAAAVATPNANFNDEEYQKGVAEQYKKLQQMQQQLDEDHAQPTVEQMLEALEILKTIFKTKKLPEREQREWFYQIIDETGMYYTLGDFRMSE